MPKGLTVGCDVGHTLRWVIKRSIYTYIVISSSFKRLLEIRRMSIHTRNRWHDLNMTCVFEKIYRCRYENITKVKTNLYLYNKSGVSTAFSNLKTLQIFFFLNQLLKRGGFQFDRFYYVCYLQDVPIFVILFMIESWFWSCRQI